MDATTNNTNLGGKQVGEEHPPIVRACTLYSMNDMLFQKGMITIQKKQQIEQEIWKKYRI